ncbi:hypothetical protein ACOMHN_043146 [Nucella lapillus]
MTWICSLLLVDKQTRLTSYYNNTATFVKIPHPGNTQLTKSPSKFQYNFVDTVRLRCKSNARLVGSRENLKVKYQFKERQIWYDINENDDKRYYGISVSPSTTAGYFVQKVYSLGVKVSSIPGCSRWYRCLLIYGSMVFDDATAETTVRLKSGTPFCNPKTPKPSIPKPFTKKTPSGKSPTPQNSDTTLATTVENPDKDKGSTATTIDDYDDSEKKQPKGMNRGLLFSTIIIGCLIFIALVAIVFAAYRRRHRRHSHSYRPSRSTERIEVVMPAPVMPQVIADPVSYSSGYSMSSSHSQSTTSLGTTTTTEDSPSVVEYS